MTGLTTDKLPAADVSESPVAACSEHIELHSDSRVFSLEWKVKNVEKELVIFQRRKTIRKQQVMGNVPKGSSLCSRHSRPLCALKATYAVARRPKEV